MESVLEQLLLQVQTLQQHQETQQRSISMSIDIFRGIHHDNFQLKQQMNQMQQQMHMMQQQMHQQLLEMQHLQMQMQDVQQQVDFLNKMQQKFVGKMRYLKDTLAWMVAAGQQLRREAEVAAKAAGPVTMCSSGTQIVFETSKTRRADNINRSSSSSSSDQKASRQNADGQEESIITPTYPTGQRAQALEPASHVINRPLVLRNRRLGLATRPRLPHSPPKTSWRHRLGRAARRPRSSSESDYKARVALVVGMRRLTLHEKTAAIQQQQQQQLIT